jgi:hypothetical protein
MTPKVSGRRKRHTLMKSHTFMETALSNEEKVIELFSAACG